jgi:AAA15 family ATPase/GTPase
VLLCEYGKEKIPFDVIASTGTHALMLLYFWIQRMNEASLVFIDEFDAFYHFELSYEVCKRLFSLNCQVFTSSHNTYLMTNDLLRPDCNFILRDNKIKALCDCTQKELRFAHNIEKIYRGNGFQV